MGAESETLTVIRGTKMVYQADTYCVNAVNGSRCGARVPLPIPYTMRDVEKAMCLDCKRANVEALAASEVPAWRENVAPVESKGACGPAPGVMKGSVTNVS
jgi:hypothetical protein